MIGVHAFQLIFNSLNFLRARFRTEQLPLL
jgi:hypothetical protein